MIILQPIVKLVNLLFTEIALLDLKNIRLPYLHLYSGEWKSLYTINPYLEHNELFMLSMRAEENLYYEKVTSFKLGKIGKSKILGGQRGFTVKLKNASTSSSSSGVSKPDSEDTITVIFE